MDRTSGFGRLAQLAPLTLSPSVPGVATALAQELFLAGDRWRGEREAPAAERKPAAAPRAANSNGPRWPSGRVA